MDKLALIVDNRLRLAAKRLEPSVVEELRGEFTHRNPKHAAMKAMGLPHWSEPRYIETYEEDGQGAISFPRGGLGRVRAVLRRNKVPWTVADIRTEGDPRLVERWGLGEFGKDPWPHQEAMVEAALEHQNCLLRAPTGAGKTDAAMLFVVRAQVPTLVVVNVVGLFDQWVERARKELGLSRDQVGIVRGKQRDLRALTVAMQKTLDVNGTEDLAHKFGAFLFDEVQLAAAPTYYGVVDPFQSKYRIGISADERRKDGKHFLTYDLFGEVAIDVQRDELEDKGYVLDVEVCVVPTEFEAPWYGVPDEDSEEEQSVDATRLAEEMAANAERNAIALECVESELEAGQQVVVMGRLRQQCREIDAQLVARGIGSGFLIGGEDYRVEFDRTRKRLERGELRVGVGTVQAIGQGIDLPKVGRLVVVIPIAGNRQVFGQVRGRACRAPEGKKDARLYYLWDRKVFGLKHLVNLVRWNKRVRVKEPNGTWIGGREYVKRAKAQSSAA